MRLVALRDWGLLVGTVLCLGLALGFQLRQLVDRPEVARLVAAWTFGYPAEAARAPRNFPIPGDRESGGLF